MPMVFQNLKTRNREQKQVWYVGMPLNVTLKQGHFLMELSQKQEEVMRTSVMQINHHSVITAIPRLSFPFCSFSFYFFYFFNFFTGSWVRTSPLAFTPVAPVIFLTQCWSTHHATQQSLYKIYKRHKFSPGHCRSILVSFKWWVAPLFLTCFCFSLGNIALGSLGM